MLPLIGAVMGGLGGASVGGIAGSVLGGIGGNIGKNIIGNIFDKILNKSNLPSAAINILQQAAGCGGCDPKQIKQDLSELIKCATQNMHPFEACKFEQDIQKLMGLLEKGFDIAKAHDEKHGCVPGNGSPAQGGSEPTLAQKMEGQSWMMQLAMLLGSMLDNKAEELKQDAIALNGQAAKDAATATTNAEASNNGNSGSTSLDKANNGSTTETTGTDGSKPSASTEFEAKAKEFSQIFEAVNNVIKTIGDALNSAARK